MATASYLGGVASATSAGFVLVQPVIARSKHPKVTRENMPIRSRMAKRRSSIPPIPERVTLRNRRHQRGTLVVAFRQISRNRRDGRLIVELRPAPNRIGKQLARQRPREVILLCQQNL